jgi:hypothetical protein
MPVLPDVTQWKFARENVERRAGAPRGGENAPPFVC